MYPPPSFFRAQQIVFCTSAQERKQKCGRPWRTVHYWHVMSSGHHLFIRRAVSPVMPQYRGIHHDWSLGWCYAYNTKSALSHPPFEGTPFTYCPCTSVSCIQALALRSSRCVVVSVVTTNSILCCVPPSQNHKCPTTNDVTLTADPCTAGFVFMSNLDSYYGFLVQQAKNDDRNFQNQSDPSRFVSVLFKHSTCILCPFFTFSLYELWAVPDLPTSFTQAKLPAVLSNKISYVWTLSKHASCRTRSATLSAV